MDENLADSESSVPPAAGTQIFGGNWNTEQQTEDSRLGYAVSAVLMMAVWYLVGAGVFAFSQWWFRCEIGLGFSASASILSNIFFPALRTFAGFALHMVCWFLYDRLR